MAKAKVKNAYDYNHIMACLKRSTGEWSYTLNIHGTGKQYPGSIDLTPEQFNELRVQLDLKEAPGLTSDTGKVYIINP
jgi:hypothetical protein